MITFSKMGVVLKNKRSSKVQVVVLLYRSSMQLSVFIFPGGTESQ